MTGSCSHTAIFPYFQGCLGLFLLAKRGKEQSVFMCVCVLFLLCSGLFLLRIWWILLVNISWFGFASNTILRYLSFKNNYSFWSFVNFTLRIDIAVFIFFFALIFVLSICFYFFFLPSCRYEMRSCVSFLSIYWFNYFYKFLVIR